MIRLTRTATRQVEELVEHYAGLGRDAAIRGLQQAVRDALGQIEAAPERGLPHLRRYPAVAAWGYHWVKLHRYWFGNTATGEDLVVTNVLYDASDLAGRVAGIGEDLSS